MINIAHKLDQPLLQLAGQTINESCQRVASRPSCTWLL